MELLILLVPLRTPAPRPTHLCSPGHMLPYWEEGHGNNADVLSRSFQRRSKSAGDTYISVSDVTLQPFNGGCDDSVDLQVI